MRRRDKPPRPRPKKSQMPRQPPVSPLSLMLPFSRKLKRCMMPLLRSTLLKQRQKRSKSKSSPRRK